MPSSTVIAAPAPTGTSIKNLPVSLFGSVMGIAGLALAWRTAVPVLGAWPVVGEAIGWVAVLAFLALVLGHTAKAAAHGAAVRHEFSHPVTGNFYGTVPIALMLLSAVVAPHAPALGNGLWTMGAALAAVLSFIVVSRLLRGNLDPALAVPAWLIPGVATLDITVTGATMPFAWAEQVNLFALAIGSVLALVFFTIILARLVHREPPGGGDATFTDDPHRTLRSRVPGVHQLHGYGRQHCGSAVLLRPVPVCGAGAHGVPARGALYPGVVGYQFSDRRLGQRRAQVRRRLPRLALVDPGGHAAVLLTGALVVLAVRTLATLVDGSLLAG